MGEFSWVRGRTGVTGLEGVGIGNCRWHLRTARVQGVPGCQRVQVEHEFGSGMGGHGQGAGGVVVM